MISKIISNIKDNGREYGLYLLCGVLTTVVNYVIYIPLVSVLKMDVVPANAIAWVAAVAFAYVTNRIWVFKSKAHGAKHVLREIGEFTLGRLITLGMEELILFVCIDLCHLDSDLWKIVIKLLASVITIIVNYIFSKFIIFKKKDNERGNEMEIKSRINELTDEMLSNLSRLVKYNSVQGEPLPEKPFGEEAAGVLNEALEIAGELGFATKNLDNYCGYAEVGEGKDIIGVAGHLDIVAAGEGWDSDPFTLTQRDGKVFGRGTIDDKGAVIASLYAVKLLQESGTPINKRVRVIMGCNEETGSKCMEHYCEVEEPLSAGFTPDGAFPGIYGEKALLRMSAYSKNTKIVSVNGGLSTNAVCERCTTVIPAGVVSIEALEEALSKTALQEFKVTEKDGNFEIFARGKAGHASTPLVGINAIGCTMRALEDAGFKDDFVEYYNSHIGLTCNGAGYNLNISDDYGCLTLNNGIASTDENGRILCTIDIRVPVTKKEDEIRKLCSDRLEDEKGYTTFDYMSDSLFFPKDSPLVKALQDAYIKVTGDTVNQPEVIGGGTYAKSLPGIIAFGCEFPGTESNMHDANEFLVIDELKSQVEIYIEAIRNLLTI